MQYTIRIAADRDVAAIERLNRTFFHERGRDWHGLITGRDSEMYVVQAKGSTIGFSGIMRHHWNRSARVIDIFVHPQYRQQGIGQRLVKYVLARMRRQPVRVVMAEAPSGNPVLSLYLKCGFRVCGFNDRYYSNDGKEIAFFLSYELSKRSLVK